MGFLKNDIRNGKGILLQQVKEVYKLSPASFFLPKNGPMTKTYAKFIMRAVDHGHFQRITNQYSLTDSKYTNGRKGPYDYESIF